MFLRCAFFAIGVQAAAASLPAPSRDHAFVQTMVSKPSKVLLPAAVSLAQAATEGDGAKQELPQGGGLASEIPGELEARAMSLYDAAVHQIRAAIGQGPGPSQASEPAGWSDVLLAGFSAWATSMVIAFIVVHTCYTRNQDPKDSPIDDLERTLDDGHFGCFADSEICICSLLCPGIRWADTISQAKLLHFWPAFSLFSVMMFLNSAITGVFLTGIFTLAVCVYYRQELRKKLHLPAWRCNTLCTDLCFLFWCSCCAIAQEAMVVRQAVQKQEDGFDRPEQQQPLPA